MGYDKWTTLIGSEGFIGGVLASILAAIIIGIFLFIFRNAIYAARRQREAGKKETELFENSLQISSPYAPFVFGVIQGRALRYFFIAVFVAYVGDIMEIFWPLNIGFYCVSLIFIAQGLRWFYKIERRAMEILENRNDLQ